MKFAESGSRRGDCWQSLVFRELMDEEVSTLVFGSEVA